MKSKADEKKKTKELIDEFINVNRDTNYKSLDEFLKGLRLFLYKKWDEIDRKVLKELVLGKIKEYKLSFYTDNLETIYEKIANDALLGVGAVVAIKPKFVFDKTDMLAIKSMRDMFYWTGVEHSVKTQEKLKSIIEDVFNGDLPRVEVAKKLESEFNGILSADRGYFEGVADHLINQSQNVARVTQALKYGIKAFRVVATIDNRTSDICRSMNGRVINAKHLGKQVEELLKAKSMAEKKNAALWKSSFLFGKLPKNFGLPPYHFRCRTMVVPITVKKDKIDGKDVIYTRKRKEDAIVHIDKSGVERIIKKNIYAKLKNKHRLRDKEIIGVLNDLKYIAPKGGQESRFVALSGRGYVAVFDANEVVSIFKPGANATNYFNKNAKCGKITDIDSGNVIERVKKWFEIL